jgi:hypothetical protein
MLEGRYELRTLRRIVAKLMQKFGEAPLRGINAAAPLDRFEAVAMSGLRDFRSFSLSAMVAPEVVVIERL